MTDEINCGKVGNVKITRVVEAEGGVSRGMHLDECQIAEARADAESLVPTSLSAVSEAPPERRAGS